MIGDASQHFFFQKWFGNIINRSGLEPLFLMVIIRRINHKNNGDFLGQRVGF